MTLVELRYHDADCVNCARFGNCSASICPSAPTIDDVGHSSNVIITTDGASVRVTRASAACTSSGNTREVTDELTRKRTTKSTGANDA